MTRRGGHSPLNVMLQGGIVRSWNSEFSFINSTFTFQMLMKVYCQDKKNKISFIYLFSPQVLGKGLIGTLLLQSLGMTELLRAYERCYPSRSLKQKLFFSFPCPTPPAHTIQSICSTVKKLDQKQLRPNPSFLAKWETCYMNLYLIGKITCLTILFP